MESPKIQIQMPIELSKKEQEIIEYVMENQLTMVSYERLWATLMACKYVIDRSISGDFVECGVWRGGNAIVAAEIFKLYGVEKKVWLYDTFKGMSQPKEVDFRISDSEPALNQYIGELRDTHNEWCFASIDEVKNNFEKRNLISDQIIFVEGDISITLSKENLFLPDSICVLRLDTDWYESTKIEMEVLYPRLSVGGCLIVDDYGYWSGSKKAVDEYFEREGNRPFFQYTDSSGRIAVTI